ncbi:MAG: L,D-transpeptidase family protein, partial [bacterium]
MMTPPGDTDVLALAERALTRAHAPQRTLPARLILVDPAAQRVHLVVDGRTVWSAPCSTAANGLGGSAGSNRTPLGWHRVCERIGAGAESGTVFVSREPTGEVWRGETRSDDLILTRILRLEGLEPGLNRGPGCDSFERYVYLHGTNQGSALGTAASHGCVRLGNADVVARFDRVEVGDLLVVADPTGNDMPDPLGPARFHSAGVGGSGMSALAQFQAMRGGRARGSDRGGHDHRTTVATEPAAVLRPHPHTESLELRARLGTLGAIEPAGAAARAPPPPGREQRPRPQAA